MDGGIVLGLIAVLIVVFILYMRRTRGYLESLGIPMAESHLIIGSPPYRYSQTYVPEFYVDQVKKYGKTWGRYQGIHPVINTIDPEILKAIFVKNFTHFSDTFDLDLKDGHKTLDFVKTDLWKPLRKGMTPIFSSGKLKGIYLYSIIVL